MIDKQEYYHGAAIIRLLHDGRTTTVKPVDCGFLINDEVFALIKYTTKMNSPWRFTFSSGERRAVAEYRKDHGVVLALVCGDDGICAVRWADAEELFDQPATWIAAERKFNKRYRVTGSAGDMPGRVPHNRWPAVVFDERAD